MDKPHKPVSVSVKEGFDKRTIKVSVILSSISLKRIFHHIRQSKFFPLVVLALALGFAPRPALAFIDATLQMQLGNPSGATTNTSNGTNFLILRTVEAISYNTNLGEPNWASWDLTDADVGNATRSTIFYTDTNLPAGYYEVTDNDYNGVGAINFNRGHLCPSEDRTDTRANNDAVFFLSNIMPQSGPNNQGPWGNFEQFCRDQATSNNEILIICGPSGFGTNTIPSGKAYIGSNTWKVAVIVPVGSGTALSRITTTTNRVIALKIPNVTNGIVSAWTNYITTAHQIEQDTGYTFFTALPGTIASAFRARIDGLTNPPAPSINSFTPTSGATNTIVTLTGTNFNSASAVKFNGVSAVFTVNSNTQIVATVPTNATTGTISVTTPGGTGTSASSFTVTGSSSSAPDLTVNVTHTGNFTQGDLADLYTLTVTNVGNAASTGTVSVVDVLPAGLTATAISGTGWTTNLGTLTATRADALAAGAGYPAITITVSVTNNAPASVTNSATVSGGSETNTVNNTATDITTILAASIPSASTTPATGIGPTNATLNATVNPNNQPTTVHFQYGTTTNYGSTFSVSGTLSGATSQAVSATVTNLTAATTYHYRVTATNLFGATNGADQSFTTATAPTPDLTVSVTHPGSFTQGQTNATYTVIVTNVGNATSTGTVTVVDSLPVGLTVMAMSGTGWTTNLTTLTATRSDALGIGATYPSLTMTVAVATNAPTSVTNFVTVSGGGETNSLNNTNSDIAAVQIPSTGFTGTLVGWDVSTVSNFGVSPLTPTTNAANLTVVGLTRGSGVISNSSGAVRAWGGVNWTNTSAATAIAANQFFTFSLAANAGYKISFSSITNLDYRRSSTGATNGLLQYQVGSGAFVDITNLAYTVSASGGASLGPIDLSSITTLQSVGAGTNVNFRLVNYGGSGSSGTCYIFDVANSPALDLNVMGTVSLVTVTNTVRGVLTGAPVTNGVALVFSNGTPGVVYYLQASTNLITWENLTTNTAPGNGVIQFTDTQATNLNTRMYRIVK